jgi:hypothetical protein
MRFSSSSVFAAAGLGFGFVSSAMAATVYNSLPSVPVGDFNIPSLGYQATSTAEFGEHVVLAGTERDLTGVTLGLSSWALKSTPANQSFGDADSFSHPLTVSLYNVNNPGPNPTVGSLITSKTITADIPYRPEVYSFNGKYFTVDFDFAGLGVTLPDEVIVTLKFNTQTHGDSPLGADGPYNSLNFGLLNGTEPSIGNDAQDDVVFWNTSHAPFYADGGAGGVGTLRSDTAWAPYTSTLSITAVPEPTTLGALALGGIALLRRRRA